MQARGRKSQNASLRPRCERTGGALAPFRQCLLKPLMQHSRKSCTSRQTKNDAVARSLATRHAQVQFKSATMHVGRTTPLKESRPEPGAARRGAGHG